VCRKEKAVYKPVTLKIILNMLNNLKVVCPLCKNHIPRGDVEFHMQNDPQRKLHVLELLTCLACPKGCLENVSVKGRDAHFLVCPMFEVQCSMRDFSCEWQGVRKELEQHHSKCNFFIFKDWLIQRTKIHEEEIKKLQGQIVSLKASLLEQEKNFKGENNVLKVLMAFLPFDT
jgi:hypothetical protein